MEIQWSDALKVGVGFMDEDHEEAVHLMSEMASAEGPQLRALFDHFTQHCREHFARENDLMARIGFFAEGCHADEHQRVMEELESMAGQNDDALAAYVREALPDWFMGHRNSMDFVTAQFAQQNGES